MRNKTTFPLDGKFLYVPKSDAKQLARISKEMHEFIGSRIVRDEKARKYIKKQSPETLTFKSFEEGSGFVFREWKKFKGI